MSGSGSQRGSSTPKKKKVMKREYYTKREIEDILNTPGVIKHLDRDLWEPEYVNARVNAVYVTGIPDRGRRVLHWRTTLDCTLANGRESRRYIAINGTSDHERSWELTRSDMPQNIEISIKKYGHHRDAPKDAQFKFPISDSINVTFHDVLKLIRDGRYLNYRLNSDGFGCLYWLQRFVEGMNAKYWFKAGSYEAGYNRLISLRGGTIGGWAIPYGQGTWIQDDSARVQ